MLDNIIMGDSRTEAIIVFLYLPFNSIIFEGFYSHHLNKLITAYQFHVIFWRTEPVNYILEIEEKVKYTLLSPHSLRNAKLDEKKQFLKLTQKKFILRLREKTLKNERSIINAINSYL